MGKTGFLIRIAPITRRASRITDEVRLKIQILIYVSQRLALERQIERIGMFRFATRLTLLKSNTLIVFGDEFK
jgi:hypothetical protein